MRWSMPARKFGPEVSSRLSWLAGLVVGPWAAAVVVGPGTLMVAGLLLLPHAALPARAAAPSRKLRREIGGTTPT